MARTGIVEGKDLMVSVDVAGTGTSYKPTAAATSHSIDYSATTKSSKRVTKDSTASLYDHKTVTGLACTIQVEALRDATAEKFGYVEMLKAHKAAKAVKVKYHFADEQSKDNYEEGLFLITKISEKSPADGDATWSATLESTGAIETKQKS